MRHAMVIDTIKCMGCHACTIACKQANATPPGVFWNRVYTREEGVYPNARLIFLPALCMHCEDPPCLPVCPTGATHRLDNGIVKVDKDKCIGCRVCMFACPYSARYFQDGESDSYYPEAGPSPYEKTRCGEHATGTVEKCDFCSERVEDGQEPACVEVCPTKARTFGDMDDPESDVSRKIKEQKGSHLKPELETNPAVYYLQDD
ncbi:4Fe-4S dicluster domain-containing protein [Thermodesulfobacteriota bacterium]